jgi:hypothetical protein
MRPRAWTLAALVVSLAALLCAVALDRAAPFPSADVARGSEEAFATGLELREMTGPQKTPERWTSGRVEIDFRNLPAGDRRLEVALHQHRQPILVVAEGVIVGSLGPGVNQMELRLPPSRRSELTLELRTETFSAGGGRRLGARFDRVVLRHERRGWPPVGLLLALLVGALGVLGAARASGCPEVAAAALALATLASEAALLWPMGLVALAVRGDAADPDRDRRGVLLPLRALAADAVGVRRAARRVAGPGRRDDLADGRDQR